MQSKKMFVEALPLHFNMDSGWYASPKNDKKRKHETPLFVI